MSLSTDQLMDLAPVIPVLVVESVDDAVPLAQALVAGGLPALEVTMRTPAALDVMRKATEADDRLELANAHRRFHVEVVALAGNRQLAAMYESVLVRIQLYMAANMRREAEVADASDGVHRHGRLLAAVERGESAEILAALGTHGARAYLS